MLVKKVIEKNPELCQPGSILIFNKIIFMFNILVEKHRYFAV